MKQDSPLFQEIAPRQAEPDRNNPGASTELTMRTLTTANDPLLAHLSAVYADCFSRAPWLELWTPQSAHATLANYIGKGYHVLAALREDSGVGMCVGGLLEKFEDCTHFSQFCETQKTSYVADFAVAPDQRKRGIGSALLAQFIEWSRHESYTAIALRTRPDNESALHVFTRLGFRQVTTYDASTGGISSPRVGLLLDLGR